MNSYPGWIQRIPEMIEALALIETERIDRQMAEQLFNLRRTAATDLLRRMGAEQCGHSWIISRGLLSARLREAQENPRWHWEVERRRRIHHRIESLRANSQRHSVIPVGEGLRPLLDDLPATGLPSTIRLTPGMVTIYCQDMQHLLEQLVLFAKALDTNYDALQQRIQPITKEA